MGATPWWPFTFFWLKKEGISTFSAPEKIAKFFGVLLGDLGFEGLKDEEAITHQLFSIKKVLFIQDIIVFNNKLKKDKLEIERIIGYGNAGLNTRMLHGNVFNIIIRNLGKNIAERFFAFCKDNRFIPFVNYYDSQRFGIPGSSFSTYLVGKAIVEGKWEKAFSELKRAKDSSIDCKLFNSKQNSKNKFLQFFKNIDFKKVSFFVSSYNSFLWNNQASLSIKKSGGTRKHHFENIGRLSLPFSLGCNIPNLFSIDGYSFIEQKFIATRERFTRNLIVTTTVFPFEILKDEFYKKKYRLTISFFLPTGCYATMLIKQIFLKIYDK